MFRVDFLFLSSAFKLSYLVVLMLHDPVYCDHIYMLHSLLQSVGRFVHCDSDVDVCAGPMRLCNYFYMFLFCILCVFTCASGLSQMFCPFLSFFRSLSVYAMKFCVSGVFSCSAIKPSIVRSVLSIGIYAVCRFAAGASILHPTTHDFFFI